MKWQADVDLDYALPANSLGHEIAMFHLPSVAYRYF